MHPNAVALPRDMLFWGIYRGKAPVHKKGRGMMRLLSKVVNLFFSLSFPIKPERLRKTIFHRLYQVIFMAQIKIITQPLNTISMSPRLHTSLFNKGSVPADKIGRDPDHCGLILFSCYRSCLNDIQLETISPAKICGQLLWIFSRYQETI